MSFDECSYQACLSQLPAFNRPGARAQKSQATCVFVLVWSLRHYRCPRGKSLQPPQVFQIRRHPQNSASQPPTSSLDRYSSVMQRIRASCEASELNTSPDLSRIHHSFDSLAEEPTSGWSFMHRLNHLGTLSESPPKSSRKNILYLGAFRRLTIDGLPPR